MPLFELNRVERRALRLAALLVVLGAAVRLGFGPGPADYAWHPAGEAAAAGGSTGLDPTRAGVEEALAREERASRPLAPGERIDINRAPEEELRRLPGVGPARARALVAAREEAPFGSVDELTRVPGIGPAGLARLREHVQVTGLPGGIAGAQGVGGSGARMPTLGSARPAGSTAASLNINAADTISLRRLPGVGATRARLIVRTREQLGGFQSVEELLEVPGIGPRTLERLRPLVRVE